MTKTVGGGLSTSDAVRIPWRKRSAGIIIPASIGATAFKFWEHPLRSSVQLLMLVFAGMGSRSERPRLGGLELRADLQRLLSGRNLSRGRFRIEAKGFLGR